MVRRGRTRRGKAGKARLLRRYCGAYAPPRGRGGEHCARAERAGDPRLHGGGSEYLRLFRGAAHARLALLSRQRAAGYSPRHRAPFGGRRVQRGGADRRPRRVPRKGRAHFDLPRRARRLSRYARRRNFPQGKRLFRACGGTARPRPYPHGGGGHERAALARIGGADRGEGGRREPPCPRPPSGGGGCGNGRTYLPRPPQSDGVLPRVLRERRRQRRPRRHHARLQGAGIPRRHSRGNGRALPRRGGARRGALHRTISCRAQVVRRSEQARLRHGAAPRRRAA